VWCHECGTGEQRVLAIDDSVLDEARRQGDPAADAIVSALLESGQVPGAGPLLAMLNGPRALPEAHLPPLLRDYLARAPDLPPVAPERLARGAAVFAEHAPEILLVLGFYSLPAAYAARNGVQVLVRTGYLEQRPLRRVFETTRAVVEMMRPGALAPGGSGLRAAQKVRLIHAAVRHLLRADTRRPWPEALGVPINQEDMAGTLMTFSFLVLDGLRKLNIALSHGEREDYLYAWTIAGALLGVRSDLLPSSVREAEALTRHIYRRQIAASAEGQRMTRALIRALRGLVPFAWLDGVPAAMIRHFLRQDPFGGVDVASLLGVPREDWSAHLVRGLVWVMGRASALGARPRAPLPLRGLRRVRLSVLEALLRAKGAGGRGASPR
jgi:hypothetical protein